MRVQQRESLPSLLSLLLILSLTDGEVLPLPSATIQLSKGGAPVMPGAGASPFVAAAASPSQSAAQRHALEATAALKTLLSVMTEKEKQQLTKVNRSTVHADVP